jgi:hypothetical protein
MATGDVTLFNATSEIIGDGTVDLDNDTFNLGLIDDTTPPTAADATPTWSDYSGNEVSGTGYTAGGQALANVSWVLSGDTTTFDADDVTWSQDAAGFDDAHWGIVYDDTAASKNAVAFVELGGPLSLISGDVTVQWGATGIFTSQVNV